ncbi:MAG: Zn-dependent alcohol dehydrogenase [Candidatus Binatia bacterium]|nr:Zn-dependent alcohol dehydrogenase [Candidatus Binatia bacterium]
MKAAVLYKVGEPLVIDELTLDPPKAGEVRVRVAANGACHSDLHVMTGDMRMPLPIVLGHEGAGIVTEVGPGVTSVREGDHVVLSFAPTCGVCSFCTQGYPHLCETRPKTLGTLLDGTTRLHKNGTDVFHFAFTASFAEETVVPESCAIKIRPDVPLDRACFVGCGTMTGIGAAINTARVQPGSSVAVLGCGGVGLNVIQGAALAGARQIIAVDLVPQKLDLAKVFGATHCVNPTQDDPLTAVMDLTGGRGVDYAFEVISTPKTIELAFKMTARRGVCTIVGVSPEGARISLNPNVFTMTEKRLQGSYYGSTRPRIDMPRLLDLYMEGKIKIDELVSRTFPLEGVNEAYDLLRQGSVARSVIKFF